ncbi:hypothetical protein A1O1_07979 [Capronia coronata CBS 617.96]|uniref:Uncharacterized protein n=1 Tax=Capronia coronata CBS 617.96 TaxID=1182541 RepID=W9XN13_9EURO|nr:uncharacterized protein A1O1_07979 [Capronia coronata CBS 617.96]EXJ81912.1 hypothetical protein A1O1_07979 [Capronia coronata CBS 617.96]
MTTFHPPTTAELVMLPRGPQTMAIKNATQTKLVKVDDWKIVEKVVVEAVVCRTTVSPTDSASVLVTETAKQEILWPEFVNMAGSRDMMGVEFNEAKEWHEKLVAMDREEQREEEQEPSLLQCLFCCCWPRCVCCW